MNKLKNTYGTTIVESIVVMLIVVIGIVGAYNIYTKSQNLITTTKNRLVATQIAREGIEAVMNIRDTNWKIFGANTTNCWMTKNYNSDCVMADGSTTKPYTNFSSGSYIAYIGANNRWYLSGTITGNFSNKEYRNANRVNIDSNGLYTQSGGSPIPKPLPLYTREIKLTPIGGTPPTKYKVESIVRWTDSSRRNGNFEVRLETELTNWTKL